MTIKTKEKTLPPAAQSVHNGFSLISNEKLVQLYAAMIKCRMIEEMARRLPRTDAPRSSVRAEAVAAGVAIDLLPDDTVAARAGDLAACYIRGIPLDALFRELGGRRNGRSNAGAEPNTDLFSAHNLLAPWLTASARLNMAAGVAQANRASNNGKVAVVFCDKPGVEGASSEILEFAATHRLPLIVVRVGAARAAGPGRAHTFPLRRAADGNHFKTPPGRLATFPVDCNDVVAVYRVAQEAIAHARRGTGPTLIECVPLRIDGAPVDKRAGDPILQMGDYLTRKGLPAERLKDAVTAGFALDLDAAVKTAMHSVRPRRKTV